MASWIIRDAAPADAGRVASFACRTFRENFTHYSPPALSQFLEYHYGEQVFHSQLSDARNRFWLAQAEGDIIAYANVGPYKLPLTPASPSVIELQRLYVAKEWQKQKIGAALMELALAEAKTQKAQTMYLGVWERNAGAQAFYSRYGFFKVGEYNFPPIGDIVDREWIMMNNVML